MPFNRKIAMLVPTQDDKSGKSPLRFKFGFNNPVLVGDNPRIIAGHGRVEAAKLIGQATVPTIWLSHLSETDKRESHP